MHRRLLLLLGLAVLATVAVVALIGLVAHFGTLSAGLRRAHLGWLALCAAGEVLAYLGYIISYQAIAELSGGPKLPLLIVLRVVGLAFGAFTIASSLGGLSVDFWMLREAGESPRDASGRVIALETLRWALLALATCVAAVLVLAGLWRRPPWGVAAGWLVVTPICFLAAHWISAPHRRNRFLRGSGLVRRGLAVAVRALIYLRELAGAPPGIRIRAVVGAAGYWAGDILCAWAAVRAFGVTVALVPLLVGYSTGLLSDMVPLPAGGSGGVDAALTGGFLLAGVPLASALLAAICFRIFTFWLPAMLALVAVAGVRGLRRRLDEIATARGEPARSGSGGGRG